MLATVGAEEARSAKRDEKSDEVDWNEAAEGDSQPRADQEQHEAGHERQHDPAVVTAIRREDRRELGA